MATVRDTNTRTIGAQSIVYAQQLMTKEQMKVRSDKDEIKWQETKGVNLAGAHCSYQRSLNLELN